MKQEKPKYRTWIRRKAIIFFVSLTFISLLGVSFMSFSAWFVLLFIPAVIFGYILAVILWSSYRFSVPGGDYQNRIHRLLIDKMDDFTTGEVLDIGCGSGHLAVEIAREYPGSVVTGVDYWGTDWEYSIHQTEKNAILEGVNSRCRFIQGTASDLPFNDDSFNAVTSCLTFHEVNDTPDRLVCLKQALRVLKPSGKFILFDLFLDPGYYPEADEIIKYIETNGGKIYETKKLSELMKLPFPLNNKKVLGYGMLITGIKI